METPLYTGFTKCWAERCSCYKKRTELNNLTAQNPLAPAKNDGNVHVDRPPGIHSAKRTLLIANPRIAFRSAVFLASLIGLSGRAFPQFETRSKSLVSPFPGPVSVATGDFNHDGKLDVAVASAYENAGRYSNQIQVLLGKGDGTFQPAVNYTAGRAPGSVAVADLNNDGKLDLIVANSVDDSVSILLGNGDGTFQPAMNFATRQDPIVVLVGDLNGDGKLDLVTVNLSDNTGNCDCVAVLLGNGDGTFQEPPIITSLPLIPSALAVGRFTNSKSLDLAVTEEFGGTSDVQILLGSGNGTFQLGASYPVGPSPYSIATADFNGDHKLDLAVAENLGIGVGVLLGNGDGTFQPRVDYRTNYPLWVAVADFNLDGKLDLVVANLDFPSGVTVLTGNGDGTFQKGLYYADGKEDRFVAVGDFNGDHQPDIVVPDFLYGDVIVMLNTGVVSLSPNTPLNFHNQKTGTTSTPQTVTLTNTAKTALTISSMTPKGQFAISSTTCGSSVAPAANCAISVTFSPQTRGPKSGTITIRDSASSKPQVIELSGTGT